MHSLQPSLRTGILVGAALLTGVLIGGITCSSTTVAPGSNDTLIGARGQCVFPRACYVVAQSGPLAGQCDDCRGGAERCRLLFVAGTAGAPAVGDMGGGFVPAWQDMGERGDAGSGTPGPMPTDTTGVCSLYVSPTPGSAAICATAQSVCVARGPRCTTGSCVAAGSVCGSASALPPQRKPGASDGELYCPFTDDVCCPRQLPDAGMSTDAGLTDAARLDAR